MFCFCRAASTQIDPHNTLTLPSIVASIIAMSLRSLTLLPLPSLSHSTNIYARILMPGTVPTGVHVVHAVLSCWWHSVDRRPHSLFRSFVRFGHFSFIGSSPVRTSIVFIHPFNSSHCITVWYGTRAYMPSSSSCACVIPLPLLHSIWAPFGMHYTSPRVDLLISCIAYLILFGPFH